MRLGKGTIFSKIDSGAYGDIFLNSVDGTVIKVFRKDNPLEHCREVYDNEIKAYSLALGDLNLKSYVPHYYGREQIDSVFDENGVENTEKYFLDLNFKMEFVDGKFIKIGSPLVSSQEASQVQGFFRQVGINFLRDASVTLNQQGKIEKVIDFSLKEIELFW